jgi:uncharacterized protein (UPF0332 family)
VTPEAESFLQKARRCLTNSNTILAIPIADVAAREAYLAGYHAAEAFIFERTGKTVKTHRGLRSEFARLTRSDAPLQAFASFLARSYELKSIADYGVDPRVDISVTDAKDAHDTASRFLAVVAGRLAGLPVN